MVLEPSASIFQEMLDVYQQIHSYDGLDQGFLNAFFRRNGEVWSLNTTFGSAGIYGKGSAE
jgi:hypothetical protein